MNFKLLLFIFLLTPFACKKLPVEKESVFLPEYNIVQSDSSFHISLKNNLACPLRIGCLSESDTLQKLLDIDFPVTLQAGDSITKIYMLPNYHQENQGIRLTSSVGDPNREIIENKFSLPFPKNRSYRIIQGYNGQYSHNSAFSRFAIDFSTAIGDTICAAADGFVVSAIESYEYGGSNKKWRDFANYITLYHPETGFYTQYVHLKKDGVLVELGEFVHESQAIGISGKTGWTDIEHLHFNALIPDEDGLKSVPVQFKEGYDGKDLTKNSRVKK